MLLCKGETGAFMVRKSSDLPIATVTSNPSDNIHSFSLKYKVAFVNNQKSPDMKGEGEKSNIMLSMKSVESKKKLILCVSAAYVLVWSFFFLTHDKGEKSE
jgi:hypothetical protein